MSVRKLMFCGTHDEPAWRYDDGSVQCLYDVLVEATSSKHELFMLPQPSPVQMLPSPATQRALAPKAPPAKPVNHYPWNDMQGMILDDSTATVLHFGLNALCEQIAQLQAALAPAAPAPVSPPPTLTTMGVDYCTVHHGLRNEDEHICDQFFHGPGECVLVPLYYQDEP